MSQQTLTSPTEDAYRQWMTQLGAPMNAPQVLIHREILRVARRLDQIQATTMSKKSQMDQRLQLLRQIRELTNSLRASVKDEKIRQAANSS